MHEATAAIRDSGVIGIIRTRSRADAERIGATLLDAGLPAIEVSMTTPDALGAIRTLSRRATGIVGAGTVLDESSATAAARAGAAFLVSPVLNMAVIAAGRRHGLATAPGVATPTEALCAIEQGADLAKLFPASAYGPAAVKDMLTALPRIPLVPTGGVSLADASQYIAAGSTAVGIGSGLSAGTPEEVAQRVQTILRSIKQARIGLHLTEYDNNTG